VSESHIGKNVRRILKELPEGIKLVAACKMRTPSEIQEAVDAGVSVIGENYVQEAEEAYGKVSGDIKWNFIGHLQKNKVKRAIKIFDMIESLDSIRLAKEIDSRSEAEGRRMRCLVEVNSGREENKNGLMPEDVHDFIEKASCFKNLEIVGLMTMGPFAGEPDDFRPYFKTTRGIFDELRKKDIPNCRMQYLSMGMSDSYKVAIEEGANIVRIGTSIFGSRPY
jgi:pyridoxal phosphate enzyme (YggS family)